MNDQIPLARAFATRFADATLMAAAKVVVGNPVARVLPAVLAVTLRKSLSSLMSPRLFRPTTSDLRASEAEAAMAEMGALEAPVALPAITPALAALLDGVLREIAALPAHEAPMARTETFNLSAFV